MNWFVSNQTLFLTILVYAMLAFSVQVALRAGVFSLAGIGCWALGGYTVAILSLRGWAGLPAAIVAVVVGGVVCYLLSLLLVRLRGLYLGMATVAFNLMVGIVALNGGELTGGPTGLYGIPATVPPLVVLLVAVVVCVLLAVFESGALGRSYEIVREDEQLANSLGVDTDRTRRVAFVVSGMLGSLGGALNVMVLGVVSPTDSGFPVIVVGLTMAIVGGFRSWRGALIGAALIQSLPIVLQSLGLSLVSDWWPAVYGALIILIAVYAPRGLFGLLQGLTRFVRTRRRDRSDPPPAPATPRDERSSLAMAVEER